MSSAFELGGELGRTPREHEVQGGLMGAALDNKGSSIMDRSKE